VSTCIIVLLHPSIHTLTAVAVARSQHDSDLRRVLSRYLIYCAREIGVHSKRSRCESWTYSQRSCAQAWSYLLWRASLSLRDFWCNTICVLAREYCHSDVFYTCLWHGGVSVRWPPIKPTLLVGSKKGILSGSTEFWMSSGYYTWWFYGTAQIISFPTKCFPANGNWYGEFTTGFPEPVRMSSFAKFYLLDKSGITELTVEWIGMLLYFHCGSLHGFC